jgi:hypothetical protein
MSPSPSIDMHQETQTEKAKIEEYVSDAVLLDSLIVQIDCILLDLWKLEKSCVGFLLESSNEAQKSIFRELTDRTNEILNTYNELKKTKNVDSGFFERGVDDAKMKQAALVKLLRIFLTSPQLHAVVEDFHSLEKTLKGEPASLPSEMKIDTSPRPSQETIPLLDTLCATFTVELKQLTNLENQLVQTKNRLKQRDEYLQNTIAETSKRVHHLEQYVAELELQRENNWSVKSHKEMIVRGGLVLHTPGKGSIEDLELDGYERILIPKDVDFTPSLGEQALEQSLQKKPSEESLRLEDSEELSQSIQEQDSDLLNLMQTLTTLAEEKELLEQDLCIVRLQVEHLEAIGKERDAVIASLYKKREQRISNINLDPSKRNSMQNTWVH